VPGPGNAKRRPEAMITNRYRTMPHVEAPHLKEAFDRSLFKEFAYAQGWEGRSGG